MKLPMKNLRKIVSLSLGLSLLALPNLNAGQNNQTATWKQQPTTSFKGAEGGNSREYNGMPTSLQGPYCTKRISAIEFREKLPSATRALENLKTINIVAYNQIRYTEKNSSVCITPYIKMSASANSLNDQPGTFTFIDPIQSEKLNALFQIDLNEQMIYASQFGNKIPGKEAYSEKAISAVYVSELFHPEFGENPMPNKNQLINDIVYSLFSFDTSQASMQFAKRSLHMANLDFNTDYYFDKACVGEKADSETCTLAVANLSLENFKDFFHKERGAHISILSPKTPVDYLNLHQASSKRFIDEGLSIEDLLFSRETLMDLIFISPHRAIEETPDLTTIIKAASILPKQAQKYQLDREEDYFKFVEIFYVLSNSGMKKQERYDLEKALIEMTNFNTNQFAQAAYKHIKKGNFNKVYLSGLKARILNEHIFIEEIEEKDKLLGILPLEERVDYSEWNSQI